MEDSQGVSFDRDYLVFSKRLSLFMFPELCDRSLVLFCFNRRLKKLSYVSVGVLTERESVEINEISQKRLKCELDVMN